MLQVLAAVRQVGGVDVDSELGKGPGCVCCYQGPNVRNGLTPLIR